MELTKFEQGLKQIVATMHNGNPSHIKKVIEQIRAIMPPTCTPNERAFLDEIREKGRPTKHGEHITINTVRGSYYELKQCDFKSNLKELVNE